jgi:cell division transport system ATP-binding protein
MIRFENVSIAYDRKSKPALDDVSLEVNRGEFVFLVGSSGSGKSTFLRLVLREYKTEHGQVYVAGQNVANVPSWRVPKFRRGIGIVFQDFRLINTKTVFANVAYAMQVIGKSRAAIRTEVPRVLELVGLEGKERRLPTELSGGEQQRVAIARAIVNQPGILLADEPTGNLDPTTSAGIMEILDKINQNGTTVVMATHDDDIVNSMRKRVIELRHGRVVRDEARAQYTSMMPIVAAAQPRTQPSDPTAAGGPSAVVPSTDDAEPQTRRQRAVTSATAARAGDESMPPRLERNRGRVYPAGTPAENAPKGGQP